MKKYLFLLLLFGCKKDSPTNPVILQPVPPVVHITKPSNILFYSKDSSYAHTTAKQIEVWLDWTGQNCYDCPNYLGRIDYYISWGMSPPPCGHWAYINYSDTIFTTHTYHARQKTSPFLTWSGSFTLKEDTCIKIEFFTHD